ADRCHGCWSIQSWNNACALVSSPNSERAFARLILPGTSNAGVESLTLPEFRNAARTSAAVGRYAGFFTRHREHMCSNSGRLARGTTGESYKMLLTVAA